MDWTRIKLVSFDVDGTLYDLPLMKKRFRGLLLERLCRSPGHSVQELRRILYFHRQMNQFRERENPYRVIDHPELSDIEARELLSWYGESIRRAGPRAQLLPLLEALQKRGIPIIACSDYRCDFKLENLGVAPFFKSRYEGSRSGCLKPLPIIMEKIKSDHHVEWDEILHIGDDPHKDGNWPCGFYLIRDTFDELLQSLINPGASAVHESKL